MGAKWQSLPDHYLSAKTAGEEKAAESQSLKFLPPCWLHLHNQLSFPSQDLEARDGEGAQLGLRQERRSLKNGRGRDVLEKKKKKRSRRLDLSNSKTILMWDWSNIRETSSGMLARLDTDARHDVWAQNNTKRKQVWWPASHETFPLSEEETTSF